MSDQNINTFAPVASDKNVNPNQESHDTSIGAEKFTTSHNDRGLLTTSIGKMIASDGAKNDSISTMKTSIEGEKLCEEDMMTMTQDYSNNIDTNHVQDSSTAYDYDIDLSGDPALMDSTAVGNGVHNRHVNDNIDCESARGASQSTCGGDSKTGHNVDESRISDYSSFVREDATLLEDSSADMALKTSTSTANNVTTNDDKATLNNGDQEGFGEQLLDSSTTTKLTQEISSNLDEKLDNLRSLTKRLLQELIVYIESMKKVASEYDRIRELEIQESTRLDNVEPAVNGACANVVLRTAGECGTRLAATPTVIQGKQQQQQQQCGSSGNRRRRHSLGLSTESIHPRRNRPLTPITNKRSGSIVDRNGKKSRGKKRVSFE